MADPSPSYLGIRCARSLFTESGVGNCTIPVRDNFHSLLVLLFLVVALTIPGCSSREPAAAPVCDSDVAELMERFGQLVELARACDEDGGECRAFCDERRRYNRRFLGTHRDCQREFEARTEADPAHQDKADLIRGKASRCRALGM